MKAAIYARRRTSPVDCGAKAQRGLSGDGSASADSLLDRSDDYLGHGASDATRHLGERGWNPSSSESEHDSWCRGYSGGATRDRSS